MTDLGKIGMTPKGDYNNTLVYERLDIVKFDGGSYVSLVNGNNYPLSETNAWMKLVEQGEDGTFILEYNDINETIATDITTRADVNSGVMINYKETTTWYDGLPINDSLIDDDIFIKTGNVYKRKTIDPNTLLKINTISDLRNTNGYYEGQEISLLGYYNSGDKNPVTYKFTITNFNTNVDDGGSIIKSSKGSWIAQFFSEVNLKDFGATPNQNIDNLIDKVIQYVSVTGLNKGVSTVSISDNYKFSKILLPSNITLIQNRGLLTFEDNVMIDSSKNYYPISNLNSENNHFVNLNIDGRGSTNTLFTVGDTITCVGNKSTVRGCNILNAADSGIMFSNAGLGSCENNIINGASDCGIYVNNSDYGALKSIIHNNVISNCVVTGIALKRKTNNVDIYDNVISSSNTGITVEDFTPQNMGYPKDFNIFNNKIFSIKGGINNWGIYVSRGDNYTIYDNTITDCDSFALYERRSSNFSIYNNTLYSNSVSSVKIGAGVDTIDNIGLFLNNKINSVLTYEVSTYNNVNTNNNVNTSLLDLRKFYTRTVPSTVDIRVTASKFIGEEVLWLKTNTVWIAVATSSGNDWVQQSAIKANTIDEGYVKQSVAVSSVTASNSSPITLADLIAIATVDATDPASTQALVNEIKAKVNSIITFVNDIKAKYNVESTMSNSTKTQLNAKLVADRNSGQQLT